MKILFLSNLVSYTYHFRIEIIKALLQKGHQVSIAAETDNLDMRTAFENMGCTFIETPFDGKGTSIKRDGKLLASYIHMIRKMKPDVVFSFTIKQNLYGGIAAKLCRTKYAPMITGLGELEKKEKLQKLLIFLHKCVIPYADVVFFQNKDNSVFFQDHGIQTKREIFLPGSGVNTEAFPYQVYPGEKDGIAFGFIGRLIPAKGIEQYLEAASYFAEKKKNVIFHIAGKCDPQYEKTIEKLHKSGVIVYHGVLDDTKHLYERIHCLVLPTYHPEGMSNVLLEAAACGRPAICTDRVGCKEIISDGENGFYCKAKDSANLIQVIERFCSLPWQEKKKMGLIGRKKVVEYFSRETVVLHYLQYVEMMKLDS